MGAHVSDMRFLPAVWCPEASPKFTIDIEKQLGSSDWTAAGMSVADYDSLSCSARDSFADFGEDATTRLGTWYTDLRTSVVVGPDTFNEREECWKAFNALTPSC